MRRKPCLMIRGCRLRGRNPVPRARGGQALRSLSGPPASAQFLDWGLVLSLVAVLVSGCVTKSTAEAQARMAYLAGQQAAFMQMQQQQARGPSVTLMGPVQNPIVKWSEGLTLRQAIVAGVYTAPADPKNIIIQRGGQSIQFDPNRLLRGEDFPLESGDIIQLQQ